MSLQDPIHRAAVELGTGFAMSLGGQDLAGGSSLKRGRYLGH